MCVGKRERERERVVGKMVWVWEKATGVCCFVLKAPLEREREREREREGES